MINFKIHKGSVGKLPTSKDHLNFKWLGKGHILFSVARQGNAASCHFASDKKGLRHIKQAINEWCDFIRDLFDWCKMIIAKVYNSKSGVINILKKCNFLKVWGNDTLSVYMRNL